MVIQARAGGRASAIEGCLQMVRFGDFDLIYNPSDGKPECPLPQYCLVNPLTKHCEVYLLTPMFLTQVLLLTEGLQTLSMASVLISLLRDKKATSKTFQALDLETVLIPQLICPVWVIIHMLSVRCSQICGSGLMQTRKLSWEKEANLYTSFLSWLKPLPLLTDLCPCL